MGNFLEFPKSIFVANDQSGCVDEYTFFFVKSTNYADGKVFSDGVAYRYKDGGLPQIDFTIAEIINIKNQQPPQSEVYHLTKESAQERLNTLLQDKVERLKQVKEKIERAREYGPDLLTALEAVKPYIINLEENQNPRNYDTDLRDAYEEMIDAFSLVQHGFKLFKE